MLCVVVQVDLHSPQQEMCVPIVLLRQQYLVLSVLMWSASLVVCLIVALICIALVTGWSDANGVPLRYQVLTPGTCDYYLIW